MQPKTAQMEPRACLLNAAQIAAAPEVHLRHPFNPKSEVHVRSLGMATGLARQQIAIGRVPPGKESFCYHYHLSDEEFLYILSGRGRAEIGDQVFEVAAGDFMGFTAPSPGHNLVNPYDEDLVYLMGGERSPVEVGRFPRAGKTIIFAGEQLLAMDDTAMTEMNFASYLPDGLPEAILKMMQGDREQEG
jgi:uncharacterized cupin superfamily protein